VNARRDDALEVARRFLAAEHPSASAAVLAGSVAAGTATSTSDLDIAIYYADRAANSAVTLERDGWLIESFLYDPTSLTEWFDREAGRRVPVAIDMWAWGIPVVGSDSLAALQQRARARLELGPEPLSNSESADLRYQLTASIDDLTGARDPGEEYAIAARVFERTACLLLMANGQWLGFGKWLIRRLQQFDDPHAHSLVEWARDPHRTRAALLGLAESVLERAGGRLQAGHTRGAP
jgi:GNAT superfamily N-acetyltransferase